MVAEQVWFDIMTLLFLCVTGLGMVAEQVWFDIMTLLFLCVTGLGMVAEQVCMTFRGVELSPAARTHLFKKLRTLSRCRLCETYVLFQGAECARVRTESA